MNKYKLLVAGLDSRRLLLAVRKALGEKSIVLCLRLFLTIDPATLEG